MRQNRSKRLIYVRALEKNCETKSFQLLGAKPPDPLTRSSAPRLAGGTAPRPPISPPKLAVSPKLGMCRIATARSHHRQKSTAKEEESLAGALERQGATVLLPKIGRVELFFHFTRGREAVPASLPLVKWKNNSDCGNYRGITLLSVPGKDCARVILSRTRSHLQNSVARSRVGLLPIGQRLTALQR